MREYYGAQRNYKLFCNLFVHYSKDIALSMADNEIARRYASSAAYLRRYLVQTFAIWIY